MTKAQKELDKKAPKDIVTEVIGEDRIIFDTDTNHLTFENLLFRVYLFDLESLSDDEPKFSSELCRGSYGEYYFILDEKKLG